MTLSLQAIIVVGPSARYDVRFRGELIVRGSRDPECDLARALLARGIHGTIAIYEDKTGKPRTFVKIEKAARLTVREDRSVGPRFVKWRPMPQMARERCEGRSPAGEGVPLGKGLPSDQGRAAL